MSKLKDSVDKHETAWHVSMVFRERQPVALPLSNFLRGATRRRAVADEGSVTDEGSGTDKGSSMDEGSGTDKEGDTDEEGDTDVGPGAAQRRGTTEDGGMMAAQMRRRHR